MPTCVTEGSYNVLFGAAVSIGILALLVCAFFYDRFSKATTNRLSEQESEIAKNVSTVSIAVFIILIVLLFVLYFGFNRRLLGIYSPLK